MRVAILEITAVDVIARSILHSFKHRLLNTLQILVVVLIFWDESESKGRLNVKLRMTRVGNGLTDRKRRTLRVALCQPSNTPHRVQATCKQLCINNRRPLSLQQPEIQGTAASPPDPQSSLIEMKQLSNSHDFCNFSQTHFLPSLCRDRTDSSCQLQASQLRKSKPLAKPGSTSLLGSSLALDCHPPID